MTVSRFYKCDLCHRTDVARLTGVFWTYDAQFKREAFTAKPYATVEHHLCDNCLEDAARIFNTLGKREGSGT